MTVVRDSQHLRVACEDALSALDSATGAFRWHELLKGQPSTVDSLVILFRSAEHRLRPRPLYRATDFALATTHGVYA